jgi:hypothetical protein
MLTPKVTAITHAGPSPYAPAAGRQSGSVARVASGSPWVSPRGG